MFPQMMYLFFEVVEVIGGTHFDAAFEGEFREAAIVRAIAVFGRLCLFRLILVFGTDSIENETIWFDTLSAS